MKNGLIDLGKRVVVEWNKCGWYEDYHKDFKTLKNARTWVRKQDWFKDSRYWYHIYVVMESCYCDKSKD